MGQGDSYCSDDIETKESIGTALLVSGGIVAAFGWVLYAQSFNAGVKQTPLQYGLAPALLPRGSTASDHVPGFVFTGRF
jgi:hypothetical protein